MKNPLRILLTTMLFVALLNPGKSVAQADTISGVYNSYYKVRILTPCFLILDSIESFDIGDRFLLMQMQDGIIDTSTTADYGNTLDYENAGHFEICEVARINQDTLHLEYQLLFNYTIDEALQIVKYGQKESIVIADTVKAKPWDGELGGVVFLNPRDTLIMNSGIDVSRMGYRGGAYSDAQVGCGLLDWQTDVKSDAGTKGESYIPYSDKPYGRGALAVGGGGGNNHNTGGGGGANAGKGGMGGREYFGGTQECVPSLFTGGRGGKPVSYSNAFDRAFMGGGGGGGHQNDVNANPQYGPGSTGSNGGGMIVIKAGTIISNAVELNADAAIEFDTTGRDGGGGGGAGGSILIESDTLIGSMNCELNGAPGKSVNNDNFINICHGPGGGGGGGLLWLGPLVDPSLITYSYSGGAPGMVVNSTSACFGTSNGAVGGLSGKLQTNLTIFEGDEFCPFAVGFFDAVDDNYFVERDQTKKLDVFTNDLFGKPMIRQLASSPTWGVAQMLQDSIEYEPFPGYTGLDTLTYRICLLEDPSKCDTAVVSLNILGGIAQDDDAVTYKETPVFVQVTLNDLTGPNTNITVYTQPQFGQANKSGYLIRYEPQPGFVGYDSLQYINCNTLSCDTATVRILVYELDAVDDITQTDPGVSVDVPVLDNDLFGPIDPEEVRIVCGPDNGIAVINQGVMTYTPAFGFEGYDTVCYAICIRDTCDTAIVSIYVYKEPEVEVVWEIPSGFSPNGDEVNDVFEVVGILFSNDNELRIFNRWGQEVFGLRNYKNSWDGSNFDGEPLPDGTYYYTLIVNDFDLKFTGYVVIHR